MKEIALGRSDTLDKTLISLGFSLDGDVFRKQIPLVDGTVNLLVTVDRKGIVNLDYLDAQTGEEYYLAQVENAQGPFVTAVKAQAQKEINSLIKVLTGKEETPPSQEKRIISFIESSYSVKGAYPFKKTDNALAFRIPQTGKWFALLLSAKRKTLLGEGSGEVRVLNLKASPEKIHTLLEIDAILPAYHMNKKHWMSILLDQGVPDSQIEDFIRESYQTVNQKK